MEIEVQDFEIGVSFIYQIFSTNETEMKNCNNLDLAFFSWKTRNDSLSTCAKNCGVLSWKISLGFKWSSLLYGFPLQTDDLPLF